VHNLLQFWNVTESIATLITDLSVLGPLLAEDKSLGERPRKNRIRVCVTIIELTIRNLMYLYIGPPPEVHHLVWFKGFW
jgi:hypothetical protein